MLNLYLIFHLNLMYSSIEEEQRKDVIKKCYFPLLDAAENFAPIGIEATGLTLEIINSIEPLWIEKLKKLITLGKVEFIGSGYSQTIGPLLPKEINIKNQSIGLNVYKSILDIKPKIALINEMAFSKGLVDIYAETGYKAIVMEWNNPYRFHKEWDKNLSYHSCFVKGLKHKLPVIWADSIAFQKFQRYTHGEMLLKDYIDYLLSHNSDKLRFFPLYANDAEIFNFRPGRYETEGIIEHNEWKRIKRLLCVLKKKGFIVVLPSETLKKIKNVELQLESSQQPIPVKKQEKYNINRWALTGRDDLKINTKIYRLINSFKNKNPTEDDHKKLLYFASSDFRTHITNKRWKKFKKELNQFSKQHKDGSTELNFNAKPTTSYKIKENNFFLNVETLGLQCVFNKKKGMALDKAIFKNISDKPLMGTVPHGYYEDISLGADFYSLHSIIERPAKHKSTNLNKSDFRIKPTNNGIMIENAQLNNNISFVRTFIIFNDAILINLLIKTKKREPAIIHPLNITFIPTAFDKNSLFFLTNNGGEMEKFRLAKKEVNHAQSLSALISSKSGLGATEGILIVGDKDKQIKIVHNQTKSALIPSVYYLPVDNTFFLRVQYSAQEIDDTFKENSGKQYFRCVFLIKAIN